VFAGRETVVARIFFGFIGPGVTLSNLPVSAPSFLNPSGDWGPMYLLAHPRNPGATVRCDFHGKVLGFNGVFTYLVSVTNTSTTLGTFFDVDTT
jgi:hypothetical protein